MLILRTTMVDLGVIFLTVLRIIIQAEGMDKGVDLYLRRFWWEGAEVNKLGDLSWNGKIGQMEVRSYFGGGTSAEEMQKTTGGGGNGAAGLNLGGLQQ